MPCEKRRTQMQLSIRDASRFVIGARLMQQQAIKASGNPVITFEHVALAALADGPDGQKVRHTIDTLGEQEAAWLRNTPSHTLHTDKVMQSRTAEVKSFTAIHRAVIGVMHYDMAAPAEKSAAEGALRRSLLNVMEAIDHVPGSRADRQGLLETLREQVIAVTSDADFMQRALHDSEQAYLAADLDKTFARYNHPALPRSEGLDDYSM